MGLDIIYLLIQARGNRKLGYVTIVDDIVSQIFISFFFG